MTDADSNDKNNPLNSGKPVSDAEETSVMKAVSDSDLNAGGAAAGKTSGTAANPNTPEAQENPTNSETQANPDTSADNSANPGEDEQEEEEKPKSGLRKFFGIMPFWAWVLTLGLIATIIVAVGAFTTMRSTETGAPGSSSNTEQLNPSYPKPTTTGKYDDDETPPTPDAGPGYGGGNQNYYAPQEPVQTEEEASTESESESEPSSSTKPSRSPRDNEPRPSQPNRGTPRPGGIGGDAGGNPSPGTGNNGNGPGNGAGNGATEPEDNPAPGNN
ncbi:hypothetical protein [Corynebacterium sp. c24Ua_83]|uniref:hypothetical protein n=1 Tax=Corynebacterium sp. c24Ua_83 TaxID=3032350 RepID=UPI0032637731